MGAVFRARDLKTGRWVALKILHRSRGTQNHELERFTREAQLLSELKHSGIVSYVSHGQIEEGTPYLVMEWLSGEDLSARLERGELTARESLHLLERVAEALSVAHQRGIVHRDIKPSNLFLRDGQLERVSLLDFGIARRVFGSRPMTRSGTVLGTLDYMAPEQARGQKDIGPAADIFSLGCVLYECLTGQPPFFGEEMAGVLAKILFEEVPPIRHLWPQIPLPLEALLGRMLQKDPQKRPADAQALLAELSELGELPELEDLAQELVRDAQRPHKVALADSELLLYSVIMAIPRKARDPAAISSEGGLRPEEPGPANTILRRVLAEFGAYSELLADGSLVAAMTQTGTATDQVAQAARCALAVQERWPDARVALATGRGVLNERMPVGEAIDRAVRLARARTNSTEDPARGRSSLDGVWLDDVSVRLLDTRFLVVNTDHGPILQGERMSVDESRPVLGKPTPCLGRDNELNTLESTLTSCIEESGARAVLVIAPPGIGKSRLRHEFQRRMQSRGIEAEILLGRGEPMSSGSPYALLSQALRRLCGMQGGEPIADQWAKLRARLTRYVEPNDAQRITEFLGELCQLPFPEEASVKLRAARNDPKIMREQVGHAFLAWLRAECTQHPVLLILEDLHWGDHLTARLVDTALRQLQDQPFMVLGLARPEVNQLFPNLWEERRAQNIRLGPLTRKVCERLVYQILGQKIRPEVMLRIVDQAAGNPLFLEELVRAHAEGKGNAMPETVLAMLQSRIARLDSGTRRVLRGASLFGATFWLGGVWALYDTGHLTEQIDSSLQLLVATEIIEQHPESRFPGEIEYSFRHILMRDAAYSMLTEEDRSLGHRLVARYLEHYKERDAIVLAEHLRRGGELERAVPYYIRAAEQSYEGNDSQGTLVRAAQGEACGARGEALGRLRALQLLAHFWRAEFVDALPVGLEAIELLPAGDFWWCTTMRNLFIIAGNLTQESTMQELGDRFIEAEPAQDARGPYTTAAAYMATMCSLHGERARAELFIKRMLEAGTGIVEQDATARGFLNYGHGMYTRLLQPDPWLSRNLLEESVQAFQQASDLRTLVVPQSQLGMAQAEIGDFAKGEATLRATVTLAEKLAEPLLVVNATLYLANLLAEYYQAPPVEGEAQAADEATQAARLDEAHRLATSIIVLNTSPNYTGFAHAILSRVLRSQGLFLEAETEARKAVAMLENMRPYRILAYINLMRALLFSNRAAEACELGKESVRILDELGGCGYKGVSLHLVLAEAHAATSNTDAAHTELAKALTLLKERAAHIPDLVQRQRFLSQVPDNVRVCALAEKWFDAVAI